MSVLGILGFLFFAVLPKQNEVITFGFVLGNEWAFLHQWAVHSKSGSMLFSIISIVAVIISYLQFKAHKTVRVASAIFSFSLFMSFLCWTASGKFIPLTGLLQGGLLLSVPLIFGAMAGVVSERSGVINIAIEGQLLFGAFASGVLASITHQKWLGLLIAPVAGALVALLLATFAIKFAIDQVILGFVLNVLVIGITGFLYQRLLIPYQSTWNSGSGLDPLAIPILAKIPLIGPIFFEQTIIVYFMYLIVARMRAVGEHPTAAESVGINVNKIRFRNVVLGGAIAGFGGAYFTLGGVGTFSRQMTAGAGFIALAALIFGKWSPMGAVGAALIFGFASNVESVLSIIGTTIPSEFMLMTPYVATVIAVSGFVGRVRAPAADGIPYKRGENH